MVEINEELIGVIVGRILEVAAPEIIILFGSAATGLMSTDSDIDLLIIEPSPVDIHEETVRFRDALRGLGFPVDLVVMASERFKETRDIVGSIAHPAHKYGKVIYEAA